MLRFTAPDGVGIAYRDLGEPGSLLPVLLHHGFAADGTLNWITPGIAAALARARHRVIALDARGHGASDKPHDPALYGEAAMSRDLMALADHLGFERYDLVGYSMGAVVSAIAASRDPRVRRLALGGVGASLVELGGIDTRVVPAADIVAALEVEDAAATRGKRAAAFRALADALKADRRALAAQARAVHAEPIALDRIGVPTLVFAGADDPLARRPEVLAAAIRGATLLRLSGDHLRAVSDPQLVAALVAFLAHD